MTIKYQFHLQECNVYFFYICLKFHVLLYTRAAAALVFCCINIHLPIVAPWWLQAATCWRIYSSIMARHFTRWEYAVMPVDSLELPRYSAFARVPEQGCSRLTAGDEMISVGIDFRASATAQEVFTARQDDAARVFTSNHGCVLLTSSKTSTRHIACRQVPTVPRLRIEAHYVPASEVDVIRLHFADEATGTCLLQSDWDASSRMNIVMPEIWQCLVENDICSPQTQFRFDTQFNGNTMLKTLFARFAPHPWHYILCSSGRRR